jgi:hypothetical protein
MLDRSLMKNAKQLPWRRPQVTVVETWAPFRAGAMYRLFDGRPLLFRSIPIVINSRDVKAKARAEKRKAREAEQGRRDQAAHRQRKRDAKKNDQVRAATVWLRESEIEELLAEVKLTRRDDDRPVTSKELRETISRAATEAARAGLKKGKK